MKNIKKLGKAVAGSALLVGATLAGAATMGAAQSSGSSGTTLGDYPQPFVDQDGNVDATIVVGSSAKTIDVVGGMNIAGSLGNAAFMEKSVSAEGGSFGWSATDGVTLDTRNDQVYFGQNLDEVRDTLTAEQLASLETTTFRDDGGDETDIENFLYAGSQATKFGKPSDRDDEDPIHYVENPADVNSGTHLFRLQANMEDEINFTDSEVQDEEIELFGRTYTVSTDSTESELVLLGSQEMVNVDSGESSTITVDGEEHTIEVVAVTDSDTSAFRVDGELMEKDEDDTFDVDGQEVRVDDVIQTNADNSQGTVSFAMGSEEITLSNGNPIEDADGDDVDGTYVQFNGGNGNVVDELSSIDVYVGSDDDDHEYVMAGESYSHPLFENYEFRYGGLNPDASSDSDNSGEVDVTTNGDDTVQISFTSDSGDSASIDFIHDDDVSSGSYNDAELADSDDETIHVVEGEGVDEDEYFMSDAGDFSHMWEVTNIDRDHDDDATGNYETSDEATVDLKDTITGQKVEVNLDVEDFSTASNNQNYHGTEVIDGQTYYFVLDGSTESNSGTGLHAYWGTGISKSDTAGDNEDIYTTGDRTTVYPALDTETGASVALTTQVSGLDNTTVELPSTESTDTQTASWALASNSTTFTVGEVQYNASDLDGNGDITLAVTDSNGDQRTEPAALVIEPEDDEDNEQAYTVTNGYDQNDDELQVSDATYSGEEGGSNTATAGWRQTATLESNDDVTAGVDMYGTYTEYDSSNQHTFTLDLPNGQAVAGAAFTTADGDLTAGGSSGSVTSMEPTGWADHGALDSDSNVGSLKQNSNLVLIGGPSVNNLVGELAQDNMTWTGSDYSEGDQLLHLVNDAFSDGNDALVVAGYSGSDTRAAANYIANYDDHQDALAGKNQLNIATQ